MLGSYCYEVTFSGGQDFYYGNTPCNLELPPGWPNSSHVYKGTECGKLDDVGKKYLAGDYGRDKELEFYGIEAKGYKLMSVLLQTELISAYEEGDVDDEDIGSVEQVGCQHEIRFRLSTVSELSDDAIAWFCRELASAIYPDGGWETDLSDVEFEVKKIDASSFSESDRVVSVKQKVVEKEADRLDEYVCEQKKQLAVENYLRPIGLSDLEAVFFEKLRNYIEGVSPSDEKLNAVCSQVRLNQTGLEFSVKEEQLAKDARQLLSFIDLERLQVLKDAALTISKDGFGLDSGVLGVGSGVTVKKGL